MTTIFSRIIEGEIPSYKVYEDEFVFAFLDINPHTLGHTLIVPKIEVDEFQNVPEPYYSAVFNAAKIIANAQKDATGAPRIWAIIAGRDVPHFHYHLIPMHKFEDLDHSNAHKESDDKMAEVQAKIVEYIANSTV